MTRDQVLEHVCQTVGIAYYSIGNFDHPSDCFCGSDRQGAGYQNAGYALEFVRSAVREKLTREGYTIKDLGGAK